MAESVLVRPRAAAAARGPAWRLPVGNPRLAAWRVLWAPFWLGSDVPAPRLPRREQAPPASPEAFGLAGAQVADTIDRLARRVWFQRAAHVLVRSFWLGLAVGCAWLALELAGGPELDVVLLVWVAAVLFGLGVLFAALLRPSRRQVARMLDRSFGLHERLTTAVDNLGRAVPKDGERASVVYLQVADAANAVATVRRHPAFALRPPVRELVLTVACGLLLASLFFWRGVGGDIPPVAAGTVPVFTPAVDRPPPPEPAAVAADPGELAEAPTSEEVRQMAERSNQAQQDLQALGRALADHAVTRDAAEAIGRGDYDAAATHLRDVATTTDQLSEAARQEMASDLDQAATEMSPESGQLSGASQEAAAGLREGQQAAQEGVRRLGDAVEQTGGDVIPQQELADQMREAEAADAQRGQQGASADQQQAESAGQPGEQGAAAAEPGSAGEAADAEPGTGSQGEQPGDQEGGPGQEAASGQGEGEQGAPGGQAGADSAAGEPEVRPGGDGAQPGGDPQNPGAENSGESEQSQAGGGAGTGSSLDEIDDTQQAGASQGGGEDAQPGDPAAQSLAEGDGTGGDGQESGDPADVTASVELPRSDGGEGVQTSNNGGSSTVGTGAGVMVGSGSVVQGEVGEAGPDSNRVPADYRSLVERYFTDPGAVP